MKLWRNVVVGLVAVLVVFSGSYAMAEDAPKNALAEKPELTQKVKQGNGWLFTVKPSLSFSFSDSRSVVGKIDGSTITVSLNLDMGLMMHKDAHEWRNTLSIAEAISRTPVLSQFIVSTDKLNFQSEYLYSILDWLGAYAVFALDTHLLPGYDVRTGNVDYLVPQDDGTTKTETASELKLTSPFSPITLKQGTGLFLRPLNHNEINMEFMLGLAAWETFADGQLMLADDDSTDPIELASLANVYQIGGAGNFRMWGELLTKRLTYEAYAKTMYPFYVSTDVTGAEGMDKLNVDTGLKINLALVQWLGITYEFRAYREPQIYNGWQIQNNLLITLSYSYESFTAIQ